MDLPAEIYIKPPGEMLFSNLPNHDLYWQALILAGHNQKVAAEKIADAIRTNKPYVIIPTWKMTPPPTLTDFLDHLFVSAVDRDPFTLSALGLFESIGLSAHNAYLNDLSIGEIEAQIEDAKTDFQTLKTFLPSEDITLRICQWNLEQILASAPFIHHNYFISQMFGAIQNLTLLLTVHHRLTCAQDYENYLSRLKQVSWQFKQIQDRLKEQSQHGVILPRFAVEKQIQMIDSFLSEKENLFYTHLKQHCHDAKTLKRAQKIIHDSVIPAYRSLKDDLKQYLSTAKANNGVWSLPNGDSYYAYMLAANTTTQLTAEEIHQLGLNEVSRIEEQIRLLLSEDHLNDPNVPIGQLLRQMASDPQFYYPDTDDGKKQCLKDYATIIERSEHELNPLFDLKPQAKVIVVPVPKHEEDGAATAYYDPPSIDGSRPGMFYVNLRSMKEHPKFRMPTLALHEAQPGHHFQCSLQNEMDLPMIRKISGYTAYTEGWALYAEKLGFEHNFYRTIYEKIGHLQDELFRAVRLVVDTGIHAKRWSREQAIDFMMIHTGYPKEGIITEVERYFVLPGQACSYKIGQLKILELRKKAMESLGKAFDIREFHNAVLKLGSVPLDVLEAEIERMIKEKMAKDS
jgi:uncharacterized protein (DUF885 family)